MPKQMFKIDMDCFGGTIYVDKYSLSSWLHLNIFLGFRSYKLKWDGYPGHRSWVIVDGKWEKWIGYVKEVMLEVK